MNKINWKDFFKNRKNRRNKKILKEQTADGGMFNVAQTSNPSLGGTTLTPGSTGLSNIDQELVPSADAFQTGFQQPQLPPSDEKWDYQGFPQAFLGGHAGWLYYCDSNGSFQQIKMGNGVCNTPACNPGGGVAGEDSTSDAQGLAIQTDVYNSSWYSNAGYNIDNGNGINDITPADVIMYCIDNPTLSAGIIECSKIGEFDNVTDASATKPCGSIYFGVWDEAGVITNNHTQVLETDPSYRPADQNGNDLADINGTGDYIYSPPNPQGHAQNACIGTSGACDSTHYLFGCMETLGGAVNYSILQVDPTGVDTDPTSQPNYDPTNFSSWVWLIGGEGFSGHSLDGNSNILNQGTAQSTWLTNFSNGTTGAVEGCDDGTGTPNATDYGCCSYIGCQDNNTTAGPLLPLNYGVHTTGTNNVNTNYVGQYTTGISIQSLVADGLFGCEDNTTPGIPDSANYDCCAYIGCPDNGKLSLVYDPTEVYHDINNPYTWYFNAAGTPPTTHIYAGSRIVGCDTAAMVADVTGQTAPTGIPDPLDLTCCWIDIYANQTAGCIDPNATNGNALNDGCVNSSITNPNDPFYGIADPNNFSCCEYNGCGNFTNQNGNWDYDGTSGYTYQYTNQVASLGVLDLASTTSTDPAGNLYVIDTSTGNNLATNPLKATNGGSINDDSCTSPLFGCPHSLASNYNATNNGGCESPTNSGFFENINDPIDSTICCEFIGCPASTADNYGPFSAASLNSNLQFGNDTTDISGIWEIDGTTGTWGFLHGAPQAFGCDVANPFNDLVQNNDSSCCEKEGCDEPTAVNYVCTGTDWDLWCNTSGPSGTFNVVGNILHSGLGIITVDSSTCITGGCTDDTQITSDVNMGGMNMTTVTHYAAANYDPTAQADCSDVPGGNDYSCCKYYGCDDWSASPTTAAPNAHNGINPSDNSTWGNLSTSEYDGTAGTCEDAAGNSLPYFTPTACNNAGGTWSYTFDGAIVGCVPADYNINQTQTDYNSAYLDSTSTWYVSAAANDRCCNYDGCNQTTISSNQSSYYTYNPHPYIDSLVADDYGMIGCDDLTPGVIDPLDTSCCQIQGCNQQSAYNFVTADAYGCEVAATGGGMELDPNDISCCEFIGCGDEESYMFGERQLPGYPNSVDNTWGTLTTPDGTIIYGYSGASLGCGTDSQGNVDAGDNSCCWYIGCNDTNALNAGTHHNGNPDSTNNGLVDIKYDDASTWTNTVTDPNNPQTICSPDGTANGAVGTPNNGFNNCCCAYKKGCADPVAQGTGIGGQTGGVYDPSNGGCEPITPQPFNCTAFDTYDQGEDSDIYSISNANFPQWGNLTLVDYGFESLDPTDSSCCSYQMGCPDSGEWNPYCEESSPGVWTQAAWSPYQPGANCSGGVGSYDASLGFGGGYFAQGNIGCDVNPNDNTPDSVVLPGQGNVDASDDLAPCCTYGPEPLNTCCLAYNLPPFNPGGAVSMVNPNINSDTKFNDIKFDIPNTSGGKSNIKEQNLNVNQGGATAANTNLSVATAQSGQSGAGSPSVAAPTYQSPFHPIPNYPNPTGGWGWIDLEPGNPYFCPNPYDPVENPNGTLLVNCDDNQPVDPSHPCPLPPPSGCPPKTGHPGHMNVGQVVYVMNVPGTWNPDTCKCDYETLEQAQEDLDKEFTLTHCCGNRETGEIVGYQQATGQSWPGGFQLANNDNCSNDLGSEWFSVPCATDCDNPYEPNTPSWSTVTYEDFKCCCNQPQFQVDVLSGDILGLQQFSNIPGNVIIPAGTYTEVHSDGCVGCNITVNHTYTPLGNYVSGAPNNPVPSPSDPLSYECCTPQMWSVFYGCVDPNADNYILGNNAYGNPNSWTSGGGSGVVPTAIGCPDIDGNPDPNNFSCCDYSTAAGCNDPLAQNYDPDHIGCILGQTVGSTALTGQGQPQTGQVDYNDPATYSCCDYSHIVGCTNNTQTFTNPYDGTTDTFINYDVDHMGCDDNGDGLPDGGQFPGNPSDQCCLPPVFQDPCAQWGGTGAVACDQMEDWFFSQYPNGTETQFLTEKMNNLHAYETCCAGQRNNCGFKATTIMAGGYKVSNYSTGGGGTPSPGFGNVFPQMGSVMQNNYINPHWLCDCGWCGPDLHQTIYYPQDDPPYDKVYKWYNGKGYGWKEYVSGGGTGPTGYCEFESGNVWCSYGGTVSKKVAAPSDDDKLATKDFMSKIEPVGTYDPNEKTQEEKEFEERQIKYSREKNELITQGWILGDVGPENYTDEELEKIEFTHLYNANGEKVNFYRLRDDAKLTPIEPILPEPAFGTNDLIDPNDAPAETPIEPTLPPTEDELSEMVKNAIKEVKLEILRKKNRP